MLKYLDNQGLYTKVLKYIFKTKQVEFLGYIVIFIGVVMDLVQVQII